MKNIRMIVYALILIIIVSLIVFLYVNHNYYVNVRIQNENALHTMRGRALYIYGAEANLIVYHFEEYLQTLDNDTHKEAGWAIHRLTIAGEALIQGVSEESGAMYHELKRTADSMEWKFVHEFSIRKNTTMIDLVKQPLHQISEACIRSFSMLKNKDPIEYLEEKSQLGDTPNANEVIGYCEQIQEILNLFILVI